MEVEENGDAWVDLFDDGHPYMGPGLLLLPEVHFTGLRGCQVNIETRLSISHMPLYFVHVHGDAQLNGFKAHALVLI